MLTLHTWHSKTALAPSNNPPGDANDAAPEPIKEESSAPPTTKFARDKLAAASRKAPRYKPMTHKILFANTSSRVSVSAATAAAESRRMGRQSVVRTSSNQDQNLEFIRTCEGSIFVEGYDWLNGVSAIYASTDARGKDATQRSVARKIGGQAR